MERHFVTRQNVSWQLIYRLIYARITPEILEVPAAAIGKRHNIRPIEVKSSKKYDHVSLDKFTAKYRNYLSSPVVLHTKDMEERNGITYLPLYMASLL